MAGQVIEVHTASLMDAPAQAQLAAILEAGHGIIGDRHYLPQQSLEMGTRQTRKEDISIISADELDAFNTKFQLAIPYGEFRRNIITRDIDLNALVGKRFRIGKVLCEGMELCEPCSKLARNVNRNVLPHLVGRAGIRAAIIEGGMVEPGDKIEATTL